LEKCLFWLLDGIGARDLEWRVHGSGGGGVLETISNGGIAPCLTEPGGLDLPEGCGMIYRYDAGALQ
jgi:hypothetical protein